MKYRLADICDIYDGPHATPPETDTGPIFLGIKNINEQCELDFADVKHLSESDYEKWTKRVTPQEDDIVFSYEATLNRYALIPKGFYGCLGRRLAIARVKDRSMVNPHYLYHYFCSPSWKAFIVANKVIGSTVLRVSIEDFPDYEVDLPDICIQNSVAKILDDIADKKKNNNAICADLGEMAKLLYDYWFVQFDFPDENGKPYKSSDGKMVWNEELKREIPEGWKVGNIIENSLTKVISAGVKKFDYKNYLPTANIFGEMITDGEWVTYKNRESRANMEPTQYSVWFAKMKNSVKHLSIPKDSRWFIEKYILSTGFEGIQCNEKTFGYIHCIVNSEYFERHKDTIAHGATQESVNDDDLRNIKFAIPSEKVLDLFAQFLNPVLEKKFSCIYENQELTSLRDFLLPMLMNGQVKVGKTGA